MEDLYFLLLLGMAALSLYFQWSLYRQFSSLSLVSSPSGLESVGG